MLTKVSIEGLPGIGKTTLFNKLHKDFQEYISMESKDFVKDTSENNTIEGLITKLLTSNDKKYLNLHSAIGESLLLMARIAFRDTSTHHSQIVPLQDGLFLSDKSIDTLFSHQMVKLIQSGYFKTKMAAYNWINAIIKPFYHFPDYTIYLKPRNVVLFLTKHSLPKEDVSFLSEVDKTYTFLYTKTPRRKNVTTIYIDENTTEGKVYNQVYIILKRIIDGRSL